MDCKKFEEAFYEMTSTHPTPEMAGHMDRCPQCRQMFNETKDMCEKIPPYVPGTAPADLRQGVFAQIDKIEKLRKMKKRKNIFIRSAAAAVAGVAIAILLTVQLTDRNQLHAAAQTFEKARETASGISTMVVELEVRSRPQDDLAVINPKVSRMPYTIMVDNSGPRKWKIKKENKSVFSDGGEWQVLLIQNGIGDIGKQTIVKRIKEPFGEMSDWFINIIDPEHMYMSEALKEVKPGKSYNETSTPDEITIVVKTVPQKTTTKNNLSSIVEGRENMITYVFDKETMLLKSLKIELLVKSSDLNIWENILETKEIKYNVPIDAGEFAMPSEINLPEQGR